MCFSSDGKTGKRSVKTAKISCEGLLTAAFQNENVAIDAPAMTCTDQSRFSGAAITCRPADADTACTFAQKNNPPVFDGEDVFDGVALFAPAVTCLACHAVFWPAAWAVCAVDDECQAWTFR